MGGDDSQKLLPWRGSTPLRGANLRLNYEFNTVAENCADGERAAHLPRPKPAAVVAQLQTTWVTFGKQTWATSPARRSISMFAVYLEILAIERPVPGCLDDTLSTRIFDQHRRLIID